MKESPGWPPEPGEIEMRILLTKNRFLPGGIKAYGNQLYSVDDYKRFVGVMPISDLMPAQ